MTTELKDIVSWFKDLQDRICLGLEELDQTAKFREDIWERSEEVEAGQG